MCRTLTREKKCIISSTHGHKKDPEMSSINCLNGHRKNSFCEWYSHSDECFQIGNSGIFHINSDLYREEKAFWEPIAMLCRNLMQEATNHSTQGLFSNNTSQRKGPFPFQIAAIFTPTLTQHQWRTKSGSSCPSVFPPSLCINSLLCYCLCDWCWL